MVFIVVVRSRSSSSMPSPGASPAIVVDRLP
jgi:hypothetical protein